ncbi:MAG TPA: hypothetical protein PKA91_06255, partial [Leptospiraceae bacterium]|nr:hypothetical protein [Leptospiraceae bacterium]
DEHSLSGQREVLRQALSLCVTYLDDFSRQKVYVYEISGVTVFFFCRHFVILEIVYQMLGE